jgi:uncharacterized protein (DUF2062 family)
MPRKYFRKFLPDHEQVRKNRFVAVFGVALQHHNLWHLHRRSVAGGMAVGLFCGLVPGPFQMLTAALLSVILRVNLPVAVMATWYTNPITIVPLYYVAYKLGSVVTGTTPSDTLAAQVDLRFDNIGQWVPMLIDWIRAMGEPFILGLILLALILAAAGYVGVLGAWRLYTVLAWRKRRRDREAVRPR